MPEITEQEVAVRLDLAEMVDEELTGLPPQGNSLGS
jgi:hypothetical protein